MPKRSTFLSVGEIHNDGEYIAIAAASESSDLLAALLSLFARSITIKCVVLGIYCCHLRCVAVKQTIEFASSMQREQFKPNLIGLFRNCVPSLMLLC